MRMRTKKNLLNLLLGAGVLLLDPLRDRVSDSVVDDLKDRAQDLRDKARDRYEMASDRVSRASDIIRGEDHSVLSQTFAFVAGVGVGVGVGNAARASQRRGNTRQPGGQGARFRQPGPRPFFLRTANRDRDITPAAAFGLLYRLTWHDRRSKPSAGAGYAGVSGSAGAAVSHLPGTW